MPKFPPDDSRALVRSPNPFDRLGHFPKLKADSPREWVYFIGARTPERLIKIGATRDVKTQLRLLHFSSPATLTLLCVCNCPRYTERFLRAVFAEYRSHGGWFAPGERLLKFLAGPFATGKMLQVSDLAAIGEQYFDGQRLDPLPHLMTQR